MAASRINLSRNRLGHLASPRVGGGPPSFPIRQLAFPFAPTCPTAQRRALGSAARATTLKLPRSRHVTLASAFAAPVNSINAAKEPPSSVRRRHLATAARTLRTRAEEEQEDGPRLRRAKIADRESSGRMLRMIMLGAPGSGKGTLSNRLIDRYDVHTMVMGDILRNHVARGTEVGKQAEEVMRTGGLLPDDLVTRLIEPELQKHADKHWILDGFPRTVGQAHLLDSILDRNNDTISLVVFLNVPKAVILERIENRWIHQPSGRVYNTTFNPPRMPGVDDITGEPLTKRLDDNVEVFQKRIERFEEENTPIASHYFRLTGAPFNPFDPTSAEARRKFWEEEQEQFTPEGEAEGAARKGEEERKLYFSTLNGETSNEIWPKLDSLLRQAFPQVKRRERRLVSREEEERRRA